MPTYYRKYARKATTYARKGFTYAKKAAKKRYGGSKGTANLVRDVQLLKRVINAEKKQYTTGYTSNLAIGQVNGNSSGHYCASFTPTPSSGSGSNERSGASIKLHSCVMNMQITGQSALTSGANIMFEVYLVKGTPYATPADFATNVFQYNPFASGGSIIDTNSQYDVDFYGRFTKIFSKKIYLPADSVTSMTNIKTVKFGWKYFAGKGHHIRFDNNTNTVVNGQLIYVFRADRGNASTSTASTITGIPITAVNTGMTVNWTLSHYYYDN